MLVVSAQNLFSILFVQPQDTACSAVLLSGVKSNRLKDKSERTRVKGQAIGDVIG